MKTPQEISDLLVEKAHSNYLNPSQYICDCFNHDDPMGLTQDELDIAVDIVDRIHAHVRQTIEGRWSVFEYLLIKNHRDKLTPPVIESIEKGLGVYPSFSFCFVETLEDEADAFRKDLWDTLKSMSADGLFCEDNPS